MAAQQSYAANLRLENFRNLTSSDRLSAIAGADGGLQTWNGLSDMQEPAQVLGLTDPHSARLRVLARRERIVSARATHRGCSSSVPISTRGPMLMIHALFVACDATGANTVNMLATYRGTTETTARDYEGAQ